MVSKWTKEEQKAHRGELTTALRSGDYKQCRGALRQDGLGDLSFCCLGVGCDVSKQGAWDPISNYYTISSDDRSGTALPEAVRDYFGFACDSGNYDIGADSAASLISDNDSKHKTFAEIADIIDDEPEGLVL